MRTDESTGFWALNDAGISLDGARLAVRRIVGAMGEREETQTLEAPIAGGVHVVRPASSAAARLDAIEAKLDEVLRQLRRSS